MPYKKKDRRGITQERRSKRIGKEKKKAAERKPRATRTKRDKPLTSEYELERTRKEINATNLRRSKYMEGRVAKYLKGLRVPASGAMMGMKGDCYIPLLNGGQYFIECKLSAARTSADKPKLVLDFKWFDKILKDYRAMNMRFGVLVIHYHGLKEDYVFVPPSGMKIIAMKSVHGLAVDYIRNDIKAVDLTMFNDKERKLYTLTQSYLEEQLVTFHGFKAAAFILPSGLWHIFTLSEFRDLMEGV